MHARLGPRGSGNVGKTFTASGTATGTTTTSNIAWAKHIGPIYTFSVVGTSTGSASQTNVAQNATSGSGTGQTWDVIESGGLYFVTGHTAGTGYATGDTITINGANVGGSSPTNNLTITVTDVTPQCDSHTNFNVTKSAGVYSVTFGNVRGLCRTGAVLKILGTSLGDGGTSPTNDLTITVASQEDNIKDAYPKDEFVNSCIEAWVAADGEFYKGIFSYCGFGWSAGALADDEKIGKQFLLSYDTNRDTASGTDANTWYGRFIVSTDWIDAPVVSGAAATDALVFSSQPTNVATGSTFAPPVTVTANLPAGGTDTAFTGSVTLTMNACGATSTGTNPRTAASGVATFTGLGASGLATNCRYTASATGVTSVDSNIFNVITTAHAARIRLH